MEAYSPSLALLTSYTLGFQSTCPANTGIKDEAPRDLRATSAYTPDLAAKIAQLLDTELYGIYHVTNSSACSWYEFAKEALSLVGSKTPILPITSAEYPQKAKRPAYSVFDNYNLKLLGLDDLPASQEALGAYVKQKGRG